jgi:hypothetical protein
MADLETTMNEIMDLFEAKDLDAFAQHVHPSFSWSDKEGKLVIGDKDTFIAEVKKYWEANPNLSSKINGTLVAGNFVTQHETVTGLASGVTEEYLWVYEFSGNKIIKQWGFIPAN